MKRFFYILSVLMLLSSCFEDYSVYYYIQNNSNEMIYIYSSDLHYRFCAHKEQLDSVNTSEMFKGEIVSDDKAWFARYDSYVYIFKKSTLDKHSVEEIESKKIYDTLYVFNGLDCKNNKNNNVVFTGK